MKHQETKFEEGRAKRERLDKRRKTRAVTDQPEDRINRERYKRQSQPDYLYEDDLYEEDFQ